MAHRTPLNGSICLYIFAVVFWIYPLNSTQFSNERTDKLFQQTIVHMLTEYINTNIIKTYADDWWWCSIRRLKITTTMRLRRLDFSHCQRLMALHFLSLSLDLLRTLSCWRSHTPHTSYAYIGLYVSFSIILSTCSVLGFVVHSVRIEENSIVSMLKGIDPHIKWTENFFDTMCVWVCRWQCVR